MHVHVSRRVRARCFLRPLVVLSFTAVPLYRELPTNKKRGTGTVKDMEAGSASFIPFCVCVANAGNLPPWEVALWSWGPALNFLLQVGIIFYALYEIDTGSTLWYLIINSTLWALAYALQPVFSWIRPFAANWADACDIGCSASSTYLYRAVNYYAFPDLAFVSVFVYIPLLIKWRYTSNVYIDSAIQSQNPKTRRRIQRLEGRTPISASIYTFGLMCLYVAGEYVLGRQSGAQLAFNALICVLTLTVISLADSAIRNSIYMYMAERRRAFQHVRNEFATGTASEAVSQ